MAVGMGAGVRISTLGPVLAVSACQLLAQAICAEQEPLLADPDVGHLVACHFAEPREVV